MKPVDPYEGIIHLQLNGFSYPLYVELGAIR